MALTLKALQNQVDDLRKEIETLKSNCKTQTIKKKLYIGDIFEIEGLKWKIIDITDKGYFCFADKLDENMQFDKKYNAWKNHALHGNCIKLCHSMDMFVEELLESEE